MSEPSKRVTLGAIREATLAARARTGKFVCVELCGSAQARLGTSALRGDFTPWTDHFPTSELVDQLNNFQ